MVLRTPKNIHKATRLTSFFFIQNLDQFLQDEKVPFLNVAARSADADSRGVNSQRFEAPVVSLRPATTKFQRAIIPRSGNRYPFSSNERVKQIAPDREIALLREAAVNYSAVFKRLRPFLPSAARLETKRGRREFEDNTMKYYALRSMPRVMAWRVRSKIKGRF